MSGNCRTRLSNTTADHDNQQLRQVMSSVHPGRPCHCCSLCGQGNLSKYFHPKSWKDPNLIVQLQETEPAADIQPDSCICRPCRCDISQIRNAGFIPRWRKINPSKPKCCHPGCSNVSYKITKLASKARVFQLLNVQVDDSQESLTDDQTALCTEHYMTFYKILNPENRKCGVCKKPLSNLSKSRKCPDPEIIQNYLVQKNTDFSGEIGIGDHMCYACYRAQLIIIKHLNNTTTSTYADLVQTLDRIKSETCDVSDIHTLEQAILYASRISALAS